MERAAVNPGDPGAPAEPLAALPRPCWWDAFSGSFDERPDSLGGGSGSWASVGRDEWARGGGGCNGTQGILASVALLAIFVLVCLCLCYRLGGGCCPCCRSQRWGSKSSAGSMYSSLYMIPELTPGVPQWHGTMRWRRAHVAL
jgi:hypothetical protein